MYDELAKRLRMRAHLFKQINQMENCIMDEAADAIELQQKLLDGLEADNDSLCATIAELERDLKRSKEYEAFWEKEANETLKNFQTTVAKIPRWIPVTEQLPSVGDKVIVAIRDESGDTRYDYTNTGWYSGNGYKWVVEDEYCSWVTHWMPLPEPPKEE